MKGLFSASCMLVFSLNIHAGETANNAEPADIASAKASIKHVAAALQTELKSAMQSGGPVAAIEVCHTRAMSITAQSSAEKGMELGRVSLRSRNPLNTPNDWQAAVLKRFEEQKETGVDISTMAWTETVSVEGGKEFRFMKAIPTQAVCLTCHGATLSEDVSQQITKLYPEDKATGYSEGDIRGAFVVTRKELN